MCGIAGILHFNGENADGNIVGQMTCAMQHRGPDSGSHLVDGPIALGHRRLAIIDLSAFANQPFIDNSGRYTLVFNGELYNFKEIKTKLSEYSFHTNSDTEVLIAAFAHWGRDCVHYFKGMFAFAVWDKHERELTLMRDRLGVKPLYYHKDNARFIFASEIRAVLTAGVARKISRAGLIEYFNFQSIGCPLSAIEGISQLSAGSWMVVKNGMVREEKYWDLTKSSIDFEFSDKNSIQKRIKELLTESVEKRLVSDVPVGAFLSGGIDSGAIVGLMAEVSSSRPATFTMGFDEKEFDESEYAEVIARKFNTHHNSITVKPAIFLEELENALNAMDTPSGDGVNTYVVSKAIRHAGIKVAMSGIGGDELFGGYPFYMRYFHLMRNRGLFDHTATLRRLSGSLLSANASSRYQRMQQLLELPEASIENLYPLFRRILSPGLMSSLTLLRGDEDTALLRELRKNGSLISKLPLLSQISVAEYFGYTQNTLLKDADQMSMAVSLEIREPFFDHDLIEFVLCVPDKFKRPKSPKSLLVESLSPMLPKLITHRKKKGFLLPWQLWMKKELRSFCEEKINAICQREFINAEGLQAYWKRFIQNDPGVRWPELWLFVVLEYWMERNNVT